MPLSVSRYWMTPLQEDALRELCVPVLSRILALEMLGRLPALAGLSCAGSHVFTETSIILDRDPLAKQLSEYMLEIGFVQRTHEEYDHHVELTPFGRAFLQRLLEPQKITLFEEERMRRENSRKC